MDIVINVLDLFLSLELGKKYLLWEMWNCKSNNSFTEYRDKSYLIAIYEQLYGCCYRIYNSSDCSIPL